jgi:hypothetical protein
MTIRCVLGILVTVAGLAVPVQAQGLRARCQAFVDSVVRDFQRNNCWPEPFVRPDRQAVRIPFALMVQSGWRLQNMLTEHHFEEGATALNEAGRLKVRWIMTTAPEHHRTIAVHDADTPGGTAARVEAVEEYAAQFAADGQPVAVMETSVDAPGWPASRVDEIDRRWADTAPDPRLPAQQASSTASQ